MGTNAEDSYLEALFRLERDADRSLVPYVPSLEHCSEEEVRASIFAALGDTE